jgi:3-isopropylmalate/(R)-2-methylmalate dehydratase large subunit
MGFNQGSYDRKNKLRFLRGCTNGRIEDFRALPLSSRKTKAANVTAWLVPGSHVVEAQIKERDLDILTDAFVLRQPGCSALSQ